MEYDAGSAYFLGVERAPALAGFARLEGWEIEAGRVRVGGYSASAIQSEFSEVLLYLVFDAGESPPGIRIRRLDDDLKGSFIR